MVRERLWVVSELYYPEETSTGYFLTRIAEGLADRFEVHTVSGRPTYSERSLEVSWHDVRNGVEIHRMRSTRFDKDYLLGRIINLLTFSLAAFAFLLIRVSRGDRLLVVTNPPTIPPLAGVAARLRGADSVLLVHDVYPEVLTATGMISKDGLASRILGAAISMTYRLYRRVIVLGRDMAEVVGRRTKGGAGGLSIIPNWGDFEEITPLERVENRFARLHNPEGLTIIQFSGNIGRTHDVETVLETAEALRGDSHIRFQFVGGGGKQSLVAGAGSEEFRNVVHLPRQPRDLLNGMLAGADAVIIAFIERMMGVSVPSRMYNVMAAGTPIIAMADSKSELALVVAEEGCGWVLSPGDSSGLADLARFLATPEGKAEASERGAKGREAVERRFSLPAVLDQFHAVLTANSGNAQL